MFFAHEEEAVQLDYPVFETGLTASEIQELSSLFELDSPNSGSEGSTRAVYSKEERKKRRMMSNRESARRSRWRKKRHLENLTVQLNRLETQNQDLKNRFGLVLDQCRQLWRENNQLTADYVTLRSRLSDLCNVIVAMHKYN
ncbi:basic leucine-zipper 5 [Euphorbia peplus]|nr:basic leucine-zipper 5 [Euphorbia peplus]